MTYRFMRIIDDNLGMFLCRIVGVLLRLKHSLMPACNLPDNSKVERILIQKYFGMGSILQAIPLISALRCNYPQATITFVTIGSNREILSLCGLADSVLIVDFNSPLAFIKSLIKLIISLLTTRFDLSIDLEFFAKFPLLIAAFSRAPIRVGLFHRKIRPEGILTHKVTFNFYRHISQIYLAYANALELLPPPESSNISLPSFRRDLEAELRSRFNLQPDEELIIVNVNSGDLFTFRKWPEQSFVSLLT
ncbi:MAG: glycosyltransferase family 9 protein, partial [Geobacter sp.]|nr:glycosyltransferase family 9 protein [Geobacter sp.]